MHLACTWDDWAFTDPENDLRGAGIDSDRWRPFEGFHAGFHKPLTNLASIWASVLLEWLYPDDELGGTSGEAARAKDRLGPLVQAAAADAQLKGVYDRELWFLLGRRAERQPESFLAFEAVGNGDEQGAAGLFGLGFAVSVAKWLHATRRLAVNESRVLWEGFTRSHDLYGEDEEWIGVCLGGLFAERHEDAEALRTAMVAQVEELASGMAAGLSNVTAGTE